MKTEKDTDFYSSIDMLEACKGYCSCKAYDAYIFV